MEIIDMIEELRRRRANLDQSIVILERLNRGEKRRRGRPPKWLSESDEPHTAGRSEPPQKKPNKRQSAPFKLIATGREQH